MNAARLCVQVEVCSPLYGDSCGILRDINEMSCLVEMQYLPPLCTPLAVRFVGEKAVLEAHAVVSCIEHRGGEAEPWQRLVEMRFVDFEANDLATPEL